MLLAVISRALTRYLDEKDALVDEIHWLVPVSLLPLNRNLPEELGNHFSLIFMSMPLGVARPSELVRRDQGQHDPPQGERRAGGDLRHPVGARRVSRRPSPWG